MDIIKIFGIGNEETLELEDKINRAVMKLNLDVLIEKEENVNSFLTYNLQRIPSVMFNDTIIIEGEQLNMKQIEEILKHHASLNPK